MEEWKSYKLGDISEIKGGKRLPKGIGLITSPNSHPYIRIRDLGVSRILELDSSYEYVDDETQKQISRYIVDEGDILLSIVGTIGLTGIVGTSLNKANLTENCVKIVNLKGLDYKFLYYFLSSPVGQSEISKGIVGAVQPKLPIKNIQNITINLPSLKRQQEIASILSSIDDKIELNNRINHNLEEQVKALYKYWFVDFEPFKDEKFKDTEIGVIPENWQTGKLSELIEICYGKDHKKLHDGSIPVYGSGGLMRFVDKSIYDKESVLIPRKGTLNNVMYVDKPFWTVDTMFYSKSKVDNIIKYCHQYLLTQDLASMNAGSAVPSMTTDILNNLIVIIPPSQIMATFDCIASSMYDEISQRNEESLALTKTRDSLLPQLMTGRYIGY